jgi:predicted GNAT family acetyltransferase
MPLRLARARDPDAFDRLAFDFLAAREAEHNLLFGIAAGVRAGEYAAPPYFAVVRDGQRVVAVALRTPPFNLVLSMIDDPAAIALLADDALMLWPDLPGVLGPTEHARRFAEQWVTRTGSAATVRTAERVFRLARVLPPRPASGTMRLAEPRDRARIAAWFVEFGAEALRLTQDLARMEAFTDRFIARLGGRAMYLWEDDGPVCMTGASAVTPHGSRVGPVYTPPALRGRGYASALVAAVSQAQLDAGRRFCFLYTDLANPTSNKIYQDIGYEPVCDVDEYRFEVSAAADT